MASLGQDLKTIREKEGLTLEQIYEQTRIPVHVLEAVEADRIAEDVEHNTTYVRSFIRTYAKALGIEESLIVTCLDRSEEGTYSGELLKQKAGRTAPTESNSPKSSETTSGKSPTGAAKRSRSAGTTAKRGDETDSTGDEETKTTPSDSKPLKAGFGRPQAPKARTSVPDTSSVNWADMGKKFSNINRRSPIWLLVLMIIVIVSGVALYFVYSSESEPTVATSQANQELPATLLPDSTALDTTLNQSATADTTATTTPQTQPDTLSQPTQPAQTGNIAASGDTLYLDIYAAYDKLEPVRVISDINNRLSPYWIEKGEAMRFEFTDSLKLRGQYGRMILLMNGHVIRDFLAKYYDREERFVEIYREDFTEPKWRQTPPDTLPVPNVPSPSVIKERPTF